MYLKPGSYKENLNKLETFRVLDDHTETQNMKLNMNIVEMGRVN